MAPDQASGPTQHPAQAPRSAPDPSGTGAPASTILHGLSVAGRFTSSAAIGAASSLKQAAVGTWTLINKGDTSLDHALLYGPHDPVVMQTNAEVADIGSRVGSAIKTAAKHPLGTIKTAAQAVESGAEKLVADGKAAETAGTLPEFLGGLAGETAAQLLTLPAAEVKAAELAADAVRGAETIGAKEGLATTEKAAAGEASAQTALRDVHFTTVEEFNKAAANPLPNTTYHYGTYSWTTDEHARTSQIHGFVEVKSAGHYETLQPKSKRRANQAMWASICSRTLSTGRPTL